MTGVRIPEKYNTTVQEYDGVKFRLIVYTEQHFARLNAKRFLIVRSDGSDSRQNFWIPNGCLKPDGTVIDGRIGWKFRMSEMRRKVE